MKIIFFNCTYVNKIVFDKITLFLFTVFCSAIVGKNEIILLLLIWSISIGFCYTINTSTITSNHNTLSFQITSITKVSKNAILLEKKIANDSNIVGFCIELNWWDKLRRQVSHLTPVVTCMWSSEIMRSNKSNSFSLSFFAVLVKHIFIQCRWWLYNRNCHAVERKRGERER